MDYNGLDIIYKPTQMNENPNHKNDMNNEFKKHLGGAVDTLKEIKDPGKFDFKKEFMNAIEILKLNEKKMTEIATRKTTATAAFLFILIGVVSSSLGTYFMWPSAWRPDITYLLINIVISIASAFVAIFAVDIIATQLFKGKGNFGQLFRVFGYSYVLAIPYLLLAILPSLSSLLGLVFGVWMLIVIFKVISVVKKLNPTHTIFTMLITMVVLAIVYSIIVSLGFGHVYGGYGHEINSLNDAMEALDALRF